MFGIKIASSLGAQQQQQQQQPGPATVVTHSLPTAGEIAQGMFVRVGKKLQSEPFDLHQYNSFTTLVEQCNNGREIQSAKVLYNTSSDNKNTFPKGQAIHFVPEAPVNTLSMNQESVEAVVFCEISPDPNSPVPLTDAYFQERAQALNEVIPQYSNKPISWETRNPRDNADDDHWREEMTGTGSVAIVKRRENAISSRYYIAARSTAPCFGKELIQKIAADQETAARQGKPPLTWSKFVDSKEAIFWHNAVLRNCCRLAHRAAEALRVKIRTEWETGTVKTSPDQAPRDTALPQIVQYISSIAWNSLPGGVRTVSQFSHCSPLSHADPQGGQHVICVSPLMGYAVVGYQYGFRPESGVLPTTTGRKTSKAALDPQVINKNIAYSAAIKERCVWQGMNESASAYNDRLHPDAYRALDQQFIERNLISQRWDAAWPVDKYETVIVKVADGRERPVVPV